MFLYTLLYIIFRSVIPSFSSSLTFIIYIYFVTSYQILFFILFNLISLFSIHIYDLGCPRRSCHRSNNRMGRVLHIRLQKNLREMFWVTIFFNVFYSLTQIFLIWRQLSSLDTWFDIIPHFLPFFLHQLSSLPSFLSTLIFVSFFFLHSSYWRTWWASPLSSLMAGTFCLMQSLEKSDLKCMPLESPWALHLNISVRNALW